MSSGLLLRGAIVFISLLAVGVVLKLSGLGAVFDQAWIDSDIRGQGLTGHLLFVAAGAVFTAVGFPRQAVGFFAGYAFGFSLGTGLAVVATALGCATTFFYARLLGRDLVAHRFSARIRRIDDFLHDNPFTMTLLIRFLPLGSNLVTNLAAGVSRVSAVLFISGSAVGYIPQTLIFALVGSGITIDPEFRISLSAVLFAASGALGVYLYRKYRHGRVFDDDLERALGTLGDNGVDNVRAGGGEDADADPEHAANR